MTLLVISLPLEPMSATTEFDYVLSDDGVRVSSAGRARADALPRLPHSGDQRIALAPVRALSWHRVSFPEGVSAGSARMSAVLEGLLEDQLLDAIDRLHFALPLRLQAGLPQWVASCDRRWLAMAVQGLEAAGQPLARVVPEWGPPAAPWRLHVGGTLEAPQAVVCSDKGVSLLPWDAQAQAWLLPAGTEDAAGVTPAARDALPALPEISAEPALQALVSQLLGRPVQVLAEGERWLRAAASPWDLTRGLQMRKRLQRGRLAWWQAPRWRAAHRAAALLAGVNLLGLNAWAWADHQQLQAGQARLTQVFSRSFPKVPVIIDAPMQMATEVRRLEQASAIPAATDLDVMLGVLSRALPAGRSPRRLDYGDAQLRLKGLSLTDAEAAALSAELSPLGYNLTQSDGSLLVQAALQAHAMPALKGSP
jgi:general secretion pathway protein L